MNKADLVNEGAEVLETKKEAAEAVKRVLSSIAGRWGGTVSPYEYFGGCPGSSGDIHRGEVLRFGRLWV